jgi:hypothetical protein
MNYFHEVRTEVVRSGPPILVEVGEIIPPSIYNFRSTFDYPADIAEQIKANGNTAGLKGLPISSDTIYIDIDEPESVATVRTLLLDLDITFEEYRTGNRGCHFHIPLASRITGTDVLYTVTHWLKSINIWHLIDTSVYREGGQFRMESAIHLKTGKPKVLVDDFDGKYLELELIEKPAETKIPLELREDSDRWDFYMNLMQKRGVGQRHLHIFILWKSGIATGLDEDKIEESILQWNAHQDDPHSEDMMKKKLNDFRLKENKCTKHR